MALNGSRGEREIDLGKLGKVVCRPSLRALKAIEGQNAERPLPVLLRRFARAPSLADTIDVIFETHLDGLESGAKGFSYQEISEAVFEIGFQTFQDDCFALIRKAWPNVPEQEGEPGNG